MLLPVWCRFGSDLVQVVDASSRESFLTPEIYIGTAESHGQLVEVYDLLVPRNEGRFSRVDFVGISHYPLSRYLLWMVFA